MAHIIVLGNEKGGSGKSTTSMHLFAAIARCGHTVGTIDLDLRQKSFFRYLENREAFIERTGNKLPMPVREVLDYSAKDSVSEAQAEEEEMFAAALDRLDQKCSFILIDCPGSHTRYAQMAHAAADTLVTPMNDSLIDFDLLARLDPQTGKVLGPSVYSEMVWKARQLRASAGLKPADWVVLRNRISTLNARNKRRVGSALGELSKRIGFRVIPGFGERVIFREMFLSGLTLLDLRDTGEMKLNISNLAARQEVREVVKSLNLPGVDVSF
ncbi:division plane positioning ATPase MipZ [Pontivivens insulae]|uniref:Sporulation initiation inhibitor protein Soj n=1 Tax=Pontivivens insulae TaxID=1639689 RepID=A0A2R8ADT6_9RHOB|nr:division plane positioning ATPase MipZ [Pontivivens insulae]RED14336.1 chromosome partitioning protein [Pontivivens insulae]SPF30413.1 Sporulation initiation inhibitor protein Soj [Pontivivens insulae]